MKLAVIIASYSSINHYAEHWLQKLNSFARTALLSINWTLSGFLKDRVVENVRMDCCKGLLWRSLIAG